MLSDTERARILGLLTAPLFGAWLDGFGDSAFVGARHNAYVCPLARYLHEQSVHDASLGVGAIFVDGSFVTEYPPWVDAFVEQLEHPTYRLAPNQRVQARTARRVLAEVAAPARAAGGGEGRYE